MRRKHRRGTPPVVGDPEGVRRAEQRLRASAAADADAQRVGQALQEVRRRNNVTAVAKMLLRGMGGTFGGTGAIPG